MLATANLWRNFLTENQFTTSFKSDSNLQTSKIDTICETFWFLVYLYMSHLLNPAYDVRLKYGPRLLKSYRSSRVFHIFSLESSWRADFVLSRLDHDYKYISNVLHISNLKSGLEILYFSQFREWLWSWEMLKSCAPPLLRTRPEPWRLINLTKSEQSIKLFNNF